LDFIRKGFTLLDNVSIKTNNETNRKIKIECECGYCVVYTIRVNENEKITDRKKCVGPCPKCSSNKMSLKKIN